MKLGWSTVTLGDISRPKQWPILAKDAFGYGDIPVYGANGVIGSTARETHVRPTVAVGCRGSCGTVHLTAAPAYINGNAMALDDLSESVDPSFLAHCLANRGFSDVISGSSQPQITRQNIIRVEVPLPPIEEQRRIAAILDQTAELLAKSSDRISMFDELGSRAFSQVAATASHSVALGEVAEFFGGSSLPRGEAFDDQEGGYLLLKVSDMNRAGNEVQLLTARSWSALPGAKASTCPQGSIVIPKRGGAISTNKKRVTARPSILDPNLMAIAPHQGAIEAAYLLAWLREFDLSSIVSGSSVPQLNKQDLAPLRVPLPGRGEQRAFARVADAIEGHRRRGEAQRSLMTGLFDSLESRAFSGRL